MGNMYLRRKKAEEIRKRYPKGTRICLQNMGGKEQKPLGLKGKVQYVDDWGHIHVNWKNGSSFSLIEGVDSFEKIKSGKKLEENLSKKFWNKVDPIIKKTDFSKLDISCNSDDTSYASEVLLKLHEAFEEVYGQGVADEELGMVLMPAVVRGIETEKSALALVLIDLEALGERQGTMFFTHQGMIPSADGRLTDEQEQMLDEKYGCYDYWYTPLVENDIYTDLETMPEQVIKIREKVDELLVQHAEAENGRQVICF